VGDAEERVHRILALHHATYAGPQPAARLGDAVMAVEDEHFYANFLINIFDGAGRAALATLDDSQDPGGSTIAQQLAKQLYGHGYWGDAAAARGYFGITPTSLDWAQAAMLAGLPAAPSTDDPLVHYALAKQRQRHVLDQLVVNHYLTAGQADAAYAEPLGLR
jgi:membrane peptidoglycan carboxypeptidase